MFIQNKCFLRLDSNFHLDLISFILKAGRLALIGLKNNREISFVTVIIMTVALSIMGLFFLVFLNLDSVLDTWNKQVKLIVYLNDNVSKKDQQALEILIARNTDVESSEFVSREIAWEKFKQSFSGKAKVIESLEFNPLPSSLVLQFRYASNRFDRIRKFVGVLEDQNGVESLEYGESWISRFEGFMIFMQVFMIAVGLLLGIGLILIVSNAVKLSIYSRKEEVKLMALLGARIQFIKGPFLIEGVFQALAGGLLSIVVIYLFYYYMKFQFKMAFDFLLKGIEFQFFSLGGLIEILFVSATIGWLGSLISINHFLNSELRS